MYMYIHYVYCKGGWKRLTCCACRVAAAARARGSVPAALRVASAELRSSRILLYHVYRYINIVAVHMHVHVTGLPNNMYMHTHVYNEEES